MWRGEEGGADGEISRCVVGQFEALHTSRTSFCLVHYFFLSCRHISSHLAVALLKRRETSWRQKRTGNIGDNGSVLLALRFHTLPLLVREEGRYLRLAIR